MSSSRIPSPARSQGAKSTPRRYKPRASRSVGSPAHSNSSIKLSAVVQMNSFALSPMPSRRSVLTDTTDIEVPQRKSWWRKLDENSREIMEVLSIKNPAEANNAIEEYIEVDILSQEKKDYTIDIPESSDGESIASIIIPQKKLFTQKESKPQNKFTQIIDNRESLAPLHKTQAEGDKTLNIGRKTLFNQGTKHRTKPLFPSALLNISANKTIANKTKELVSSNAKGQVKTLFGNRPGTKRKNMFADFIVSDSEDDIPEIQPKVFEFHKKAGQCEQRTVSSHQGREPHLISPTSSITDIEMDEWQLLPSSTMVEHELEDGFKSTPSKKARLAKLSEVLESDNRDSNITTNKIKHSNKSMNSKRMYKNLSQSKEREVNELIERETTILELDIVKETTKASINNESQKMNSRKHNNSKNKSQTKISDKSTYEKENKKDVSKENSTKSISDADQVLQNDNDDEDFSLVYENDDINVVENYTNKTKASSHAEDPQETSKVSKRSISKNVSVTKQLQIESNSVDSVHQASQNSDNDTTKGQPLKCNNNDQNNSQSKLETYQKVNDGNDILKCNMIDNCEEDEIQTVHTTQNNVEGHTKKQESDSHNSKLDNKNNEDECITNISDQNGKDYDVQTSVTEEVRSRILQKQQNSTVVENCERHINDNDRIYSEEEEGIINNDSEENRDREVIGNQIDPEEIANNPNIQLESSVNNDENYEIKEISDENDHNQEDKRNTRNEKSHLEFTQNQLRRDLVHNEIIDNHSTDNSKNQNLQHKNTLNKTSNNESNVTRDCSFKKNDTKVPSPEVILHKKPSQMESFTVQGRNTSVRKTKSITKNLTIRPSLAPLRESIDITDGSKNSSVEGSGWDSHRTTRRTLRQTFGKDFTPRKSLRTLVMEKSAKRQTNFIENNADFSRFPQANSTELPKSVSLTMDHSDLMDDCEQINGCEQRGSRIKSDCHIADRSGVVQKCNKSDTEVLLDISVPSEAKEIHDTNYNCSHNTEAQLSNEADAQELNNSDREIQRDNNDDVEDDEVQKNNESDHAPEMNDVDAQPETDDQSMGEIDSSDEEQKLDEPDRTQENNDSDNEYEVIESNQATSEEFDNSEEPQHNLESEHEEENVNTENTHETDECEEDIIHSMDNADNISENEADDSDEISESGHEVPPETDEDYEESQINTSLKLQEINESSKEINESRDYQDAHESDNDAQEVNNSEDESDMIESNRELSSIAHDTETKEMEYELEMSRNTRQTTLEMYLQKVKNKNLERKKQLENEIRNSLKAPSRDVLNPFKIPAVPNLRRVKTQQIKTKTKVVKSSVIPLNMLPVEVLEDMKYKPPKRFRPTNASWITKRLYKFLETKLEAKYDYKARIRSEKLVETIYNFTKDIRRHSTAPPDAIDTLKREMARLNVVKTHFEFYEFFHEYMPREVRVKVVPDLFNKISLPKHGVFSDILR